MRRIEWQNNLSDVLSSLISAGLRIDFPHGYAFSSWQPSVPDRRGRRFVATTEELRDALPLTFSLKATKG